LKADMQQPAAWNCNFHRLYLANASNWADHVRTT
jgi:hypothetical protein